MSFHDRTTKEVFRELNSSDKGLTSYEADKRLQQYGKNVLGHAKKLTLLKLIARQFTSPLVWVLLGAMAISFSVGERTDFYVIGAIVVLNTLLGVFQEYRAERAIEALQKLTALKARVLRDGREIAIDASDLVPGDVVLLETGDKVPADLRLFETINFQTQEAALTGESTPVTKKTEVMSSTVAVADRKNLAYASTIVTAGRAQGVVIGTGKNTEIGKIATLIHETESMQTPLQRQLRRLSTWITVLVLAIAAIVFLTGILEGQPVLTFLIAAIALAVAAIPEGLPAVVTVALALGVQRMASRNALIRKLPSAETLGSCTVICSDKTGTLTHNQMTVRKLWVDNAIVNVTGTGYATEGTFSSHPKDLEMLLTIGMLNNNSKVTGSNVIGDPTEASLVVSARKFGLSEQKLSVLWPRIAEIEFTSERKKMTTFHQKGKTFAFVKGAPDVILHTCTKILLNGKSVPLTPTHKKAVLDAQQGFANDALRVLGFAYRETNDTKTETGLVFVGLQAMIDPPREEAKQAILECSTAGIKVVMITGDHLGTAYAIARELGIPGRAITGEDLEKITDLAAVVNDIGVYARVNPEHKLKIVAALQARQHVVAMTGDGVNDAPALKKADIGIAMGSGTDVAKEASAMILADDNFASIVAAVKEGRRIYDNLTKFITYLFSSNIGEVLTVFGALV
ncbi:HAD-IC family P-type ATPase, partial [Candidatus Woesearchaeota archaeon]|nr:HAD-IC family P-type ATPase [Candidatus Woesearchaeota archaeon]